MVFVRDDHVVDEFSLARSNPTLSRSVLPRASERRALRPYSETLDCFGDLAGEDGVVVENQMLRSRFVGEGLPQLLNHPGRGGISSHAEVDDLPSLVIDHEPHVQQSKSEGRNYEEVHGSDVVLVIAKKRHPSPLLAVVRRLLWEISRYGRETHGEAELLKFRVDLSCTPAVFKRETSDKGLELVGCSRTAWRRA